MHFFERDTPYYAQHRDAPTLPYADVHLYSDWQEVRASATRELHDSDVGMVTSYCPDGRAACDLVLQAGPWRTVFYDMDTPVTLSRLDRGEAVDYVPLSGFGGFDLVLSYTGGEALHRLRDRLGAKRTAALYGWVDPEIHHREEPREAFAADLSYLGTYAADRQQALEQLLLGPARLLPDRRFFIAGAMYPDTAHWPKNVRFFPHVSPPEHSSFYSSSPLTLNVTRGSMAALGYCPSGRLFEAAACGSVVLSDWWEGLDTFFEPGEEILIARSQQEAIAAISRDPASLKTMAARAQQRALACHTASIRALRFLSLLEDDGLDRQSLQDLALVSGKA